MCAVIGVTVQYGFRFRVCVHYRVRTVRRCSLRKYFIFRCGACLLDYNILCTRMLYTDEQRTRIHEVNLLPYRFPFSMLCDVLLFSSVRYFVCHRTPTVGLCYFVNKTIWRPRTAYTLPCVVHSLTHIHKYTCSR